MEKYSYRFRDTQIVLRMGLALIFSSLIWGCIESAEYGGELSGDTVISNQTGSEVPTFGIFEKAFEHTGNYSNPYTQITAKATFRDPKGNTQMIPLFWNGEEQWKVRLSPNLEGSWAYSISSNDPGLNGQTGSLAVVKSANQGGIQIMEEYPYHFEYQDRTPFWFFGDTNWQAFGINRRENLNRESYKHYIDVRAAQGFNYIHSNLLKPGKNEGGSAFHRLRGERINPIFWQEVDTRLQYANSQDITVMLFLAWANLTGKKADGAKDWGDFPDNNARLRYARYVAARYSAYNVAFNVAGEWNEFGDKAIYEAIGETIESNDPHNRIIAIHPGSTQSVEEFAHNSWLSLGDYQQNYKSLHNKILAVRDHNKPVVNAEYAYYLRDRNGDGDIDKQNSRSLEEIRHATWDIVMAGGYFVTGWGTTYHGGYLDPGPFDPNASKNHDWEEDVQHIHKFFTELAWWKLNPHNELLKGSGPRYALAEIGEQYVVYTRDSGKRILLSLGSQEASAYSVKLFNPRTGAYASLADYTGNDSVLLSPPDSQDWAFVLTKKD
ncbi:MAG: DUF4038 domain-containing protein [Cyanobacteria bacterium J06635_1]